MLKKYRIRFMQNGQQFALDVYAEEGYTAVAFVEQMFPNAEVSQDYVQLSAGVIES